MNKYFLLFLLLSASFAWWDSSWSYRRSISFDGTGSGFTSYVFIDTKTLIEEGKIQPRCGDIRVIRNDINLADYKVINCNSTSTVVFFKVVSTQEDYSLYYGNPSADPEDSSSFLLYYDDFDQYDANSTGDWNVREGSFRVGFYRGDQVYRVNSTGKSIATIYRGDHSIYALFNSEEKADLGMVWNYTSGSYDAAYLNLTDSKLYVCNTTCSPYTTAAGDSILLDGGKIFVAGRYNLTVATGQGELGIFADSSEVKGFFETFVVFDGRGVKGSAGSEEQRPEVTVEFEGIQKSNMKTITVVKKGGSYTAKIMLEPGGSCSNVEGNSFETDYFEVEFNSTGYAVNGSYRDLGTQNVSYFDGCEKITLEFYRHYTDGNYWHLVQFFKDSPIIKHVVFASTNSTLSINETIAPEETCQNYLTTTGYVTCENGHSPGGEFNTQHASFCNLHWRNGYLYEPVNISEHSYYKHVFWENWNKTMGCRPFYRKIELICGTDFTNCTAESDSPLQILFYTPQGTRPLGRVKYSSNGITGYGINGQRYSGDLIDTSKLTEGMNYLTFYGSGNVSSVNIYLSDIYNAENFFGEKPDVYRWKVRGPVTGASTDVCGIPVLEKVYPFTCYGSSVSAKLDISTSEETSIYVLKIKTSYDGTSAVPYPAYGSLQKVSTYLPMAGAREIPPLSQPPTHNRYTTRRFYYKEGHVAELVMSVWKAV